MKLFGWKSAGRAVARPLLAHGFSTWGSADWPRSYEAQLRELYLGNAVAQRAVRLVAEGVASAPLGTSDPKALALVSATSGGQSLLETVAMQLLLHGNAYVELLAGPDGAPAELFALRPERVSVEPDPRGWPMAFVYRAGAATTRLASDRVIHIRTHHPLDDHYGLGCLDAAAGAMAAHNAATRWNKALLDNAARPSGALVAEGSETLTTDQFTRLRQEMEESFSGSGNVGRPMLLEGGLRWQAMSLSPTDMDFAGLKAAAAREIALAFGVPSVLLGLPGDATYANYREANKALWRQAILPLAGKILDALAEGLSPWFAGLKLSVDLDQVPALSEDRERLWAQVNGADFVTVNEKRAMVGLEPIAPAVEMPKARDEGGGVETKFNPWHDPGNGQFAQSGQGVRSDGAASSGSAAAPSTRSRAASVGTGQRRAERDEIDDSKIGKRTVREASNILTNETNGLSGGPPGELARAKTALAHAIHNGLVQKKPPKVAPATISAEAEASVGRVDDKRITRTVFTGRLAGAIDPTNGAIYYGTSKDVLTSRRIASGRQDVLLRFGPFDHGSGSKQYVYIYGEPYKPKPR
ncbi:phage portal protein [Aquisediminimonas profunda]|uniref:phage portal protein n=1 Tax=Aquisediminimonas profunda TaxID=1550733 RepID=UPI001C624CFF